MGPRLRVGLREEDGEVSFVDVIWGSGEVGKWRSGEVEKWSSGEVEKWRSGEVEKWRSGEVEKWRSGEVEKWRSGELIYGGGWSRTRIQRMKEIILFTVITLRNRVMSCAMVS
jgi:hypothetical protein